nr:immunoglobulin heavy chain junction region [Macaca mulatta]MOX92244.1 immunoglobulin heavy chain junction region [Macaca mulatta]MOX94795.1 immunoglobulin heavy chain junction region [Macaca mulatta]MOX95203.1 immunoglobulin heavy chain junction region [Macaca mulatta]MOX95398.1 immunoglobulin heavy chain junction region [Macaca mulatta]
CTKHGHSSGWSIDSW